MCLQIIYSIQTYKEDLALNNLQWLICHKTQPNHLIMRLKNVGKCMVHTNNHGKMSLLIWRAVSKKWLLLFYVIKCQFKKKFLKPTYLFWLISD